MDDDGPVMGLIHRMQDAVGGAAGQAAASSAAHSAPYFIREASLSNLHQIEASALAEERSSSVDVRALAMILRQDHGTSQAQLQLELQRTMAEFLPPAELDARRQSMIDHLRRAPDAQFDTSWLDQQLLAHKEALTLFGSFGEDMANPSLLTAYARAQLPVLRHHEQIVERLRAPGATESAG